MNKIIYILGCVLFLHSQPSVSSPITGNNFLYWQESQKPLIQNELGVIFKEENGFTVTGPLAPLMKHNSNIDEAFQALRVICHHSDDLCEAITIIQNIPHLSLSQYFLQPEYEGVLAIHHNNGLQTPVLFCTLQQTRYMIWYKDQIDNPGIDTSSPEFQSYAQAILEYFDNLEDLMPFDPPKSGDYDLPPSCDLFPEEKPPVISQTEYQELLSKHQGIDWGTIKNIKGFIPCKELKNQLILQAPQYALQDENKHLFQKHLQMLYESQGRDLIGKPLTHESMENAEPGMYLFAVAISGKARFAKVSTNPEYNSHAVLLLGEPALCAGGMNVEGCDGKHISSADIFSSEYLFSPYSENIYEVITNESNHYLSTIGHLLKVLKDEGIPHTSMIIEKY